MLITLSPVRSEIQDLIIIFDTHSLNCFYKIRSYLIYSQEFTDSGMFKNLTLDGDKQDALMKVGQAT